MPTNTSNVNSPNQQSVVFQIWITQKTKQRTLGGLLGIDCKKTPRFEIGLGWICINKHKDKTPSTRQGWGKWKWLGWEKEHGHEACSISCN
jgi:hypothetical protein